MTAVLNQHRAHQLDTIWRQGPLHRAKCMCGAVTGWRENAQDATEEHLAHRAERLAALAALSPYKRTHPG